MMDNKEIFNEDITATLGDLKRLVDRFTQMGMTLEAKVPLTYIIQAMYPNVPDNLNKSMREIYDQAFQEGYKLGRGANNDTSN